MRKWLLLLFFCSTVVAADNSAIMQDLRWRLLGPLRAGWSICAEGIPEEPNTFYFGGADGGVWKTIDAGTTWQPISDKAPFSSVGALAIGAGNPRVIYVGTGHVDTRYDVMDGTGVYKSEDDGKTWISLGLNDTRHVGRIFVDPRNPNIIFVAALGHLFGPNPERGVFRSEDGGRNWKKVLFVDENTGAVDLSADLETPDVIYAALWQVRERPWQSYFTPEEGPGSGIWKSTDGGKTWMQTSRNGLPNVPLSRIGLAVAPKTHGQRIYATVKASKYSGLYRSDDGGGSWHLMNDDDELASTYFGRVTAHPLNPDVIYVMGRSVHQSNDGGKNFAIIKGSPGGDDYHYYWINPKHLDHSILASDQGTTVSIDNTKTWSPWYNQATGQFYRLAADNRFPYWIYSGQQDSGTVGIMSRSDYGQLSFRDWHPVGADERDFDLPDPDDPNIVFGSGLGGRLSRWDARTGRVANVSPWPVSSYAAKPTTVKYRYTWITPVAFSMRPGHALFHGAQVLFKSTNKGNTWQIISPDLTGSIPNTKNCEDNVPLERATTCGYGVIYSISPSSIRDGLIWMGTDNGRILVTRDDGKNWTNVTPPMIVDWSKIASIDASPTDPGTAYVAVDRHRMDDRSPHMFRTHDYGKSWTAIARGIPEDSWVNVVRQDVSKAGLLYAGTRTGVFISFDDGDHWLPLQLNLPRTGVNDLLVHVNDLIAATQGRALWILDDVTPLRFLNPTSYASSGATLVAPAAAIRISRNENRDTPLPPEFPTTPNPLSGAVIDYFLPHNPQGAVALSIVDANGKVIRSFRSDETPKRPQATKYFADFWTRSLTALSAHTGHNRFVWNLRYERPKAPEYEYSIAATPWEDTPALPQGIQVLPGKYLVRLTVEGKTLEQPLTIQPDPRSHTNQADLQAEIDFYFQAAAALAEVSEKYQPVKALDKKLQAIVTGKSQPSTEKEIAEAEAKRKELEPLLASTGQKSIAAIVTALTSLVTDLEAADGPPTEPQRNVLSESMKALKAVGPLPKL